MGRFPRLRGDRPSFCGTLPADRARPGSPAYAGIDLCETAFAADNREMGFPRLRGDRPWNSAVIGALEWQRVPPPTRG